MDTQNEHLFWKPKSIEQLALEQRVTGPQSLDKLTGAGADLWKSDGKLDHVLASITC